MLCGVCVPECGVLAALREFVKEPLKILDCPLRVRVLVLSGAYLKKRPSVASAQLLLSDLRKN